MKQFLGLNSFGHPEQRPTVQKLQKQITVSSYFLGVLLCFFSSDMIFCKIQNWFSTFSCVYHEVCEWESMEMKVMLRVWFLGRDSSVREWEKWVRLGFLVRGRELISFMEKWGSWSFKWGGNMGTTSFLRWTASFGSWVRRVGPVRGELGWGTCGYFRSNLY